MVLGQDKIYYNVLKTELGEDKLISTLNGRDYILVDDGCLYIEEVQDLTNNGFDDLILEVSNGCGGNCCGYSYQIITFDGSQFHVNETVGWDWDGLNLLKTSFGYFFEVDVKHSLNPGQVGFCKDKTELYKLNNHTLELVSVSTLDITPSIIEINTLDVFESFNRDYPEKIYIQYDIDNDSNPDSIVTSHSVGNKYVFLYETYIRINNETKIEIPQSRKRIGVLNSVTNGFHDLVIDCDEILIWNGTEYISK